jgi:hypothetical protein
MVVCPEIAKTGSPDTLLAFFIRIWEGSIALRASWEVFRVLDEPPIPFPSRSVGGRVDALFGFVLL